jgi:dihydrolipoamide dehydrogenase
MNRKIVVVGGGPGGYVAAIRAAQLGAAVTLIEKESLGGTCLNHGCIPSKIMQTTAKMVRKLNHCDEYGININGAVSIDMAALMSRKDRIIHNQITGIESLLKRNKVTYVRGHGRIKRKGFIEVRSAEDGFREIEWDKLILATGSKTLEVDAFPFDNNKIISSTQALGLETVPESMVIVGGGVIGCELACILSDMGVAITIVEALDRLLPLPSVDRDCSKVLQREMKKRKIRILINKTVTAIDVGGPNTKVTIGPSSFVKKINERDRESIQLKVDKVLICIGRQANTDGLGLEALGVKMD